MRGMWGVEAGVMDVAARGIGGEVVHSVDGTRWGGRLEYRTVAVAASRRPDERTALSPRIAGCLSSRTGGLLHGNVALFAAGQPDSGKIAGCRVAQKGGRLAGYGVETTEECVVSEVIEVPIAVTEYKSWVCLICGWIYNEEEGLPEEGIAPGTRFAAIPDEWRCPLCDVGKAEFAVVEF